jgi:ATP-dependent Lhr-like helicase
MQSAPPDAAPGPRSDAGSGSLDRFGPAARAWFTQRFGVPTPVQVLGWQRIGAGEHALLAAPTGSGKTLAAFFACIDALTRLPAGAPPGVRVLYVSPLKALVYDIERNLRAPLEGIRRSAEALGLSLRVPRVAVRTGDTPEADRRRQARDPAEILVTTPESLYLILGSQQRETLARVETVIVDEIHALAPTKRGAHLALSLERVAARCARDPQRIGLSATARPLAEVARFLGGDRPVAIVDAAAPPALDLQIRVPAPPSQAPAVAGARSEAQPSEVSSKPPQAARSKGQPSEVSSEPPQAARSEAQPSEGSMWDLIVPQLVAEIRGVRSSIVFTNSRGLCERLCQRINEEAGEELARAHHGSLAHDERRQIEEALKAGGLRAIVATSSLELGVDMDAVDLVLLVESPGAVARGLQRVGRAGHGVGRRSRGVVYPKHRGDLLEAAVVARGMREGAVEALRVPQNPLDVLAQQIVAICAAAPTEVDALAALVRRAAPFRALSREALEGVLDMLAGRYPSAEFAELRARIHWDRAKDRLEPRPGARQLALVSGGTIPDRGLYAVHRGEGGPRVGELDEEMVYETRVGEVVTLGASSWRVDAITRDRVLVSPAPGEAGKLPFWRGDGPGRPLELGLALGAFVRELAERCGGEDRIPEGREAAETWLREVYALDAFAASSLVDYVAEQQEATGCLPTDRAITVERTRDELGDWRVCILSPFGARVHAPWALAIEACLAGRGTAPVQALWGDDGIVLRLADADEPPELSALIPDPDEVEAQVVAELGRSALFAGQFRENAARALLLPRRRPGARTPLFAQRLRAQNLLAVAREFPAFPIVLETYRSCLQDVFDLPALTRLLRDVRARRVRVDEAPTSSPSPFARSLVFAYTAAYLYQGDTPVAERRARALALDSAMLRDLLGAAQLRTLLDAQVLSESEALWQGRAPERRARDAEALQDLLRRVGDLAVGEIAERCEGDPAPWLARLEQAGRALRLEIAGEPRWIAAEDAGLYRDALGASLPTGLPEAFLTPVPHALEQLVLRFARSRGPFSLRALAARTGLPAERLAPVLGALAARERLRAGEFDPRGSEPEWCDPDSLRRLRQRTLEKLRGEIEAVDAPTFARFLAEWHGIGESGPPEARLRAALEQLEGLPLSFAELERLILPARVRDFDPRWLDDLGSRGEWVWVGCGSLGERDLRVALFRRDRVSVLCEPPEPPHELSPLARTVWSELLRRGACFAAELAAAARCSQPSLQGALWELSLGGLATNDTLAALRELAARRELSAAASRRRRRGSPPFSTGGRWAPVAQIVSEDASPTRRLHARAEQMLERYGVVSRAALSAEGLTGGFTGLYAVYRQMEEIGKLRRGHFVEALAGAQFARAGVVDRLRGARAAGETRAWLLAATDPANPYGALLPWPAARVPGAPLRRVGGACVVLVDGALALYLERGGRAFSFGAGSEGDARLVTRAASALPSLFAWRRRRGLRIREIDGMPAARSPLFDAFAAAGFHVDYKGIALDRSDVRA